MAIVILDALRSNSVNDRLGRFLCGQSIAQLLNFCDRFPGGNAIDFLNELRSIVLS
jgi:hypothetical protein